uniref:Uncharacterized protein n=1 Tax=Strigamia maritima TaxID=126957 RepID=T1J849_STRMM
MARTKEHSCGDGLVSHVVSPVGDKRSFCIFLIRITLIKYTNQHSSSGVHSGGNAAPEPPEVAIVHGPACTLLCCVPIRCLGPANSFPPPGLLVADRRGLEMLTILHASVFSLVKCSGVDYSRHLVANVRGFEIAISNQTIIIRGRERRMRHLRGQTQASARLASSLFIFVEFDCISS